jgi:hypothetical protein
MKLSILICSLISRERQFKALVDELQRQCGDSNDVEILASIDNGRSTVGAKRMSLLEQAKGDFVVSHDDDDSPAKSYVQDILSECKDGIDCIGFRILCYGYVKGKPSTPEMACVSNRFTKWAENVDGFRYVRCPHHLVPVRRTHALKAGFDPKSRYGEDHAYSMRLQKLGLLRKEAFIDKVLYTIHHDPHKKFGE